MTYRYRRFLVVGMMLPACGGVGFAPKNAAEMAQAPAAAPAPMAPADAEGAPAAPGMAAGPAQGLAKTAPPADAVKGPIATNTLLVYEAELRLAVYRVEEGLSTVERLAKDLGGYLVERSSGQIVIRVPKQRFEEALSHVNAVGDVVFRNVRSFDVTDQFRDLEVRLRNARAVRDRLADLLGRAQNVEDSLKIERELARVTEEIERLTGTLDSLSGRIAYSKITVTFEARPVATASQTPDKPLTLPFPFLDGLGLSPLLNLHE